jgi:hypothetical protein
MKLFWGPHTCAIGAHIILEETGHPYELEELDVAGGETQKPPFKEINPKKARVASSTRQISAPPGGRRSHMPTGSGWWADR